MAVDTGRGLHPHMSLVKILVRIASSTSVAEMVGGAMGVKILAGTDKIEGITNRRQMVRIEDHSAIGVAVEIEGAINELLLSFCFLMPRWQLT